MTGCEPQTCTCPTAWFGLGPAPICSSCRFRMTACAPMPTYQTWNQSTAFPFKQHLSDEDVERIAQRVAELLKSEG